MICRVTKYYPPQWRGDTGRVLEVRELRANTVADAVRQMKQDGDMRACIHVKPLFLRSAINRIKEILGFQEGGLADA